MHGFSDPLLGSCHISMGLKGAKRVKSRPVVSTFPITPAILVLIKDHLDFSNHDDKMFWAACCTAFFGLLRSAEVTTNKEELTSLGRVIL